MRQPLDEYIKNWNFNINPVNPWRTSNLTAGALIAIAKSQESIANSAELMAKRHAELMADRNMYKRWYNEERTRVQKLQHQNAGLRGYITRQKKQMQAKEGRGV